MWQCKTAAHPREKVHTGFKHWFVRQRQSDLDPELHDKQAARDGLSQAVDFEGPQRYQVDLNVGKVQLGAAAHHAAAHRSQEYPKDQAAKQDFRPKMRLL